MSGFANNEMNYKAAMAQCPDFNCIGMICIGPTDPDREYWKAVHVWEKRVVSCLTHDMAHFLQRFALLYLLPFSRSAHKLLDEIQHTPHRHPVSSHSAEPPLLVY